MPGLAFQNTGPFTMVAGEALAAERLVLMSSSTLIYADGGEQPIGVTKLAVASGELQSVELLQGQVLKVTGSKAITAGTAVYTTTDGKVSDAAVGLQVGTMIEAISADGGKAACLMQGPLGGNGIFSSNLATITRFEDHFTSGSTEDGQKFSETANKGDWLKTSIDGDSDAADICNVATDGPGGILVITCNDKNLDAEQIQLTGSSFKCAVGKSCYFEASIAVLDVDKMDWFVGLAIPDLTILGGVNDRIGFECLGDGNIDCLVEEGTNENLEDTLVNITDCAAIANFAATKVRLAFLWDGVDSVFFFVNGVLTNTMTDNAGAITIPDGVVMTPTIAIEIATGAGAVQTMWTDYVDVQVSV